MINRELVKTSLFTHMTVSQQQCPQFGQCNCYFLLLTVDGLFGPGSHSSAIKYYLKQKALRMGGGKGGSESILCELRDICKLTKFQLRENTEIHFHKYCQRKSHFSNQ